MYVLGYDIKCVSNYGLQLKNIMIPEVPSAWYTLYRVNFHISRVNNHLMPESILDHFVYVRSPTVGLFFVAVLHSGLQCLVIILYPAHVIVS